MTSLHQQGQRVLDQQYKLTPHPDLAVGSWILLNSDIGPADQAQIALLTFRRGGTGKIISLSHLTLVCSKKMMRHDLETGLREGFKCKSSTDGSTLSL